jgi:hypothetical protein
MPGLYRVKDGWRDGEDSAVVGSRQGLKVEITERDYRDLGFAPAFDELKWKVRKKYYRVASLTNPMNPRGLSP